MVYVRFIGARFTRGENLLFFILTIGRRLGMRGELSRNPRIIFLGYLPTAFTDFSNYGVFFSIGTKENTGNRSKRRRVFMASCTS